jgi:nicotinamidase-related amidase
MRHDACRKGEMQSRRSHSRAHLKGQFAQSPVVLVLIDFINPLDFDGADSLAPAALEAALATAKLKHRCDRFGYRSIYANDNYGLWQSNFADVWRDCVRRAGPARKLAETLRPSPTDFTILKPRHSAFYCTPLELLLTQLKARRLILTGLAADNCVLFTAMDAYVRQFQLWIPGDCVAAESEDAKANVLDYMARVLKAETRAARDR